MSKVIFLSHILDENTPSYGNRNKFLIEKKSDIQKGDKIDGGFIFTPENSEVDYPQLVMGAGYNSRLSPVHKIVSSFYNKETKTER